MHIGLGAVLETVGRRVEPVEGASEVVATSEILAVAFTVTAAL